MFPMGYSRALPWYQSNHNPILYTYKPYKDHSRRAPKFELYWLNYHEFLRVQEFWHSTHPQTLDLHQRLRSLLDQLHQWDLSTYGDLQKTNGLNDKRLSNVQASSHYPTSLFLHTRKAVNSSIGYHFTRGK